MMKLLVNNAVELQGLSSTQLVGTLLDGSARHTPEGSAFSAAAADNLAAAIAARDKPFGDYGFGARTVSDSLLDWTPPSQTGDNPAAPGKASLT
jgi:hypothetical protein